MEQARCWMWARANYSSRPHLSAQIHRLIVGSSYNQSWEEKAFAEDAAGHLGGCVWPPRSYSCSFCRREFGSAQALGGHMNVHRRDRARLRQCSSIGGEAGEKDQQHSNPCVMVAMATEFYPPQVNPNPNSGFQHHLAGSMEDSTPLHLVVDPQLKLGDESLGSKEACDGEERNCRKRRRTETTLIFFRKSFSCDQQRLQPEALNHGTVEELDLELRLGDAPKAKAEHMVGKVSFVKKIRVHTTQDRNEDCLGCVKTVLFPLIKGSFGNAVTP
ncbi:hypothetical protein BHM03_00052906 [Ensete ventricosum]|nr:hypothetical protein BHM03_00052906 [Ensete ventricosum]